MADEVLRSVQRASRLTMQLLAFSRRDIPNRTKLDLNNIVQDMEKLLKRVIGEHIDLMAELEPDLGLIEGDGGSMEQVITNLAVNSTDAMPEGVRLRISTANVRFDEKSADRPAEAQPGPYVMLAVCDEGEGIPPSVLPQIFEPFFTTKVRGTGTGLGLATVYGIVKRSNGHIIVKSESGRGTEIRIYLPRVAGRAEAGRVARRPERAEGGSEMVLVVEDEPAVRSLARRFLESSGYTVAEAGDAAEAMAFVTQNPGKIDLLLTDVIMPEQSGPELAKRVRVIQPDVKILYMSGYPGEFIARYGVSNAELGYLQKPFSREQLIVKTREVLDAPRRARSSGATPD
jgi:CheY-like chemotaxis protein